MILPISRFGSSYSTNWNPASGLNSLDPSNFNRFSQAKTINQEAVQQHTGFKVELHNVPAALQWIANEIEKKFKLKVKNSDIQFTEEELRVLYYALSTIPAGDLKGVKSIVKNRSLQLNLEEAPSGVFAKKFKTRAYGAYDKENQRIFIFELDKPDQLVSVLKHEVGHAYHSYNMSFDEFFYFTLKSGWDVAFHEQSFIHGNSFYNMGYKRINIPKKEAMESRQHFDWDSLRSNKDKYNKYVLIPPADKKDLYAFTNPFETFAVFYEKTR